MKVIFMVRLLGLMCEIKSMQGMTRELNTKESIENIAQICNLELEEIPHCDTINDVFEKVKVEEIEEIPTLYIVDLLNMDTCRNELILEDIRKYGRKI